MIPSELLKELRGWLVRALEDERNRDPDRRLGTIPAGYVGGRPTVRFDGETTASTKTYPYLSSYAPAANDRVALERFGSTWLIIGKPM